jgi:hypothetical protein
MLLIADCFFQSSINALYGFIAGFHNAALFVAGANCRSAHPAGQIANLSYCFVKAKK